MKPVKRTSENREYEKVKTDDFVTGIIDVLQYDESYTFFKGTQWEKQNPAIRFKFKIDGYKFPHYSRWMFMGFGGKEDKKIPELYTKYVASLVEGADQDMDFELDQLKGMRVKMLWQETKGFQSVAVILPLEGKILAMTPPPGAPATPEGPEAEVVEDHGDAVTGEGEVPF